MKRATLCTKAAHTALALLGAIGMAACGKGTEVAASESVFEKDAYHVVEASSDALRVSEERWRQTRGSQDYSYAVQQIDGQGRESRLVWVAGDRVVKQSWTRWSKMTAPGGTPDASWTELANEVGIHDGAQPLTLEQWYNVCREQVLPQPADRVTLGVGDEGALRRCVYVPRGCKGDCSFGVSIDALRVGGV